MTEDQVKVVLKEVLRQIAPEIKFEDINLNSALREQIDIDSYDFFNLLVQIEKKANIHISESKVRQFSNLSQLTSYIAKLSTDQKAAI